MIWENIYTRLSYFLFSRFVFYSFQYKDLSNSLLRSFNNFWFSFSNEVTTWTYNFVSMVVKTTLLELASIFSVPSTNKTQCFVHLSFNFTLQLINGISSAKNYLDILLAQGLLHIVELLYLERVEQLCLLSIWLCNQTIRSISVCYINIKISCFIFRIKL